MSARERRGLEHELRLGHSGKERRPLSIHRDDRRDTESDERVTERRSPHKTTYGSAATIFLNSDSVKARSVSDWTLPCIPVANASLAAVSSSGASDTITTSYRPMTR